MKINVSFNKKSIQNAIKQIKAVQKKVQTDLPRVYLQKCVESIKAIANRNIAMTNIGSEVKALIQTSWITTAVIGNKITLLNNAEYESGKNLAVFVEFGVGRVGGSKPHAVANKANYQYNVWSMRKDPYERWTYTLEGGEDRMNIESGYYEGGDTEKGFYFKTAGSPATMFLYNAWKEWQTTGLYKTLWEQTKTEVLGRNA